MKVELRDLGSGAVYAARTAAADRAMIEIGADEACAICMPRRPYIDFGMRELVIVATPTQIVIDALRRTNVVRLSGQPLAGRTVIEAGVHLLEVNDHRFELEVTR